MIVSYEKGALSEWFAPSGSSKHLGWAALCYWTVDAMVRHDESGLGLTYGLAVVLREEQLRADIYVRTL
jgi:hypothetical protein